MGGEAKLNKGTLIQGTPAPFRVSPGSQGPGRAGHWLRHPVPARLWSVDTACYDLCPLPKPGAASLPPSCCLGISVLHQAKTAEYGLRHQARLWED